MNITITNVLKDEVTVSGQPLKREYVENVMLPMLMAQCGRNNGAKFGVIKAFDEAGLSLKAIQEDALTYFETKRAQKAEREKLQREADERAERLREPTPRELAQAKADKEERAAAHRAHAQKILAARSRNNG
ncbi:hypothetical protein AO269_20020 [Pseudomonas putida]|nr:hypothetical protein AO269_20020 [Pseudomonas putida]